MTTPEPTPKRSRRRPNGQRARLERGDGSRLLVIIPTELHDRLRRYALDHRTDLTTLTTDALEAHLRNLTTT